uniref:Reverse transcriptase domain-containing protein n=1 Tax=Fagus sylvatica TaxID=28930 RepID=A0A2N9FMM0_FAGSY
MWLKADGFKEKVEWWDSYIFYGTPSYIMACKLKALKSLDALADFRHLTGEELQKKALIVADLERTSLFEEISWRQKSRALWLWEWDKNTKFFHWKEEGDRPLLDGLDFSMISEEDGLWLERPFDEEEVAGVVAGFNGDKALGPDGFSMGFFQCCWDILNPDVMVVLNYFHGLSSFEKSLNATFVSLIPKKTEALEVKDFRPISPVEMEELDELLYFHCSVFHSWLMDVREGFFPSSRGLRQVDPLSPLLFVIVMEALSCLLDRAVREGLFVGFSAGTVATNPLMVSHLLFADDTLIFCGADSEQILNLRFVFTWFEAVSVCHCNLGLPLGATFKETAIWNPVLERVEKRLASWKRLYLSKGGKITLIKSTLTSIPTYFLSLFPIPARVANRLEKLQRDFLWCGMEEKPKFHLVNWSQICAPLQVGGLAVRNLSSFNKALLGKWLWRYGLEREALWRLVVDAKYGSLWGGWCSKSGKGPYGVSVWKFIRKGWNSFQSHCSFLVGDGQRVRFWEDWWCGDMALKDAFPELFVISQDTEVLVADLMSFPNGLLHWDFHFVRNVKDWELESLTSFMDLLYSCHMERVGEDRLGWRSRPSKGFTVKNFYHCLCPSPSASFPWKFIWKAKVPPRIAFFSWTAALGKLLTIDNLRKRNLIIID